MSYQVVYANCDERISSITNKIAKYQVKALMCLLVGSLELGAGWKKKVESCENDRRLIQIEKMIYTAHDKQRKATLPLLFEKYSEKMAMSLELGKEEVEMGFLEEGSYLEFCRKTLFQRDFIKKMCGVA